MNTIPRTFAGRTLASAAALAAASLTLAGPAFADGPATSPTPSDDTPVQVAPLVQPSVVYETVSWSGYVYDRYNHQYLRNKPFTVTMQCTGFVVNPDGYVATAGHCVAPDGGKARAAPPGGGVGPAELLRLRLGTHRRLRDRRLPDRRPR